MNLKYYIKEIIIKILVIIKILNIGNVSDFFSLWPKFYNLLDNDLTNKHPTCVHLKVTDVLYTTVLRSFTHSVMHYEMKVMHIYKYILSNFYLP